MLSARRRLLLLLAALPVILFTAAFLYMTGMAWLEGEERGFLESLQWAAETFTTTGYGVVDGQWSHPAMVALVILLQFFGVFLVFLVFPIYFIPFLEERFETRLPQTVGEMRDHVLVFRAGPAVETLLARLKAAGVPTLVVDDREAEVRRLYEQGQKVLFRTCDEKGLQCASLLSARAIIANGTDEENAAFILAVRQMGFRGDVSALVEAPFHRQPMLLAGANAAFTPRHILGAALADRASTRLGARISGVQQLGERLQVSEMRVRPGSPLAGKTLAEAAIPRRTGVTVIGQWVGGTLQTSLTASMRIEPNGILIAVSTQEGLSSLEELAEGARPLRRTGPFVIGGYGEVGRKIAEILLSVDEEVWVINRTPREGVDIVGDVLAPGVLDQARLSEACAVILALDSDSATLFATMIVKNLTPDVPVISRVNQAENIERMYGAGVDFALSVSHVSGQVLARHLLLEEAVEVDADLKVRQVSAERLAGSHPVQLRIREKTKCSVVAVERGEQVLVQFDPEFRFEHDDVVYISGSADAVGRFEASIRSVT